MAKLQLSNAVTLEIAEMGKVVDTYKLSYKEPSKKEQKEIGKGNKDILDLFKSSQKLDRRIEVMEAKVEALKELNNAEELLDTAKKLDDLYQARDKIEDDFDKLGGFDKMLEASEVTFGISVGGKDKKRLVEFVEAQSDYATVLTAIAEDAKEQKGN